MIAGSGRSKKKGKKVSKGTGPGHGGGQTFSGRNWECLSGLGEKGLPAKGHYLRGLGGGEREPKGGKKKQTPREYIYGTKTNHEGQLHVKRGGV